MSFFKELKRRNVVRVGIAYTVATWLLIQVTDTVFPRIGLPESAVTLVIALLFIGFIPALIFAWAFEMTPDGIKREKEVDRTKSITPRTGRKLDRMIIGIMTVVIAFLILDRFVLTDDTESSNQKTQIQAAIPDAGTESVIDTGPSIAVLPFVNMSGDADNEYFSDGLTETLLHMLAQLPGLRVAARTSSFAFKGKNAGIEEISKALNVAHILEGSVQKSGNRVRITAQLIRAEDGFHVWSQNYDRTLEDIFAIQDEIAKDVAGALDSTLLDGEIRIASVETSDVSAYDTYLRATEQQAIGSYGSLSSAESLFKQALSADAGFIDAKLALARNYLMQFNTGLIDEDQMQQAMTPLLSQVREVQPDNRLARAIETLAHLVTDLMMDQDTFRKEVNELRLLLPLLPSESYIRAYVAAMIAFGLKQPEVGLQVLEAGFMVDPLSSELYGWQGNIYVDMERYEDAQNAFLKAIELNPLDPNNYLRMAAASAGLGDITGIFKWRLKNFQADPQDHEVIAIMAGEFYGWGLPEEGDRWLERVRALAPNSDTLLVLYLQRAHSRGDAAELIEIAEKMIATPVSMRESAFPTTLFYYRHYMSLADRHEDAYDYLTGLRPDIQSFERLPEDIEGVFMQGAIIELMSGFKSPGERKTAWALHAQNLRANGEWWFETPGDQAEDFFFMGDLDSAIEKSLEDLAKPVSSEPTRGDFYENPTWAAITSDPRVAARLSEMKQEKQLAREQIKDMLQGPEWEQ
jgi:TolB-like protein